MVNVGDFQGLDDLGLALLGDGQREVLGDFLILSTGGGGASAFLGGLAGFSGSAGGQLKMLSFAGLEPGYFQSGQSESNGHMIKHGFSKLRCALMNCCLPLISNEPVFAEYYAKKRAEGKTRRVAMTHAAKKLLRVIYTLQSKNIPYDPTLIR